MKKHEGRVAPAALGAHAAKLAPRKFLGPGEGLRNRVPLIVGHHAKGRHHSLPIDATLFKKGASGASIFQHGVKQVRCGGAFPAKLGEGLCLLAKPVKFVFRGTLHGREGVAHRGESGQLPRGAPPGIAPKAPLFNPFGRRRSERRFFFRRGLANGADRP
jgi:hypothetical protein